MDSPFSRRLLTWSTLFGEPGGVSVPGPVAARFVSARRIVADVTELWSDRYGAAAPAACRDAVDVPEQIAFPVSLAVDAEAMSTPGADRSSPVHPVREAGAPALTAGSPRTPCGSLSCGARPYKTAWGAESARSPAGDGGRGTGDG